MPEGPEVKIVVDGLNDVLKNKYIVDIEITPTSRYRNKAPNGFNDFKSFSLKKKQKLITLNVRVNLYILKLLQLIIQDNQPIINGIFSTNLG
jgi:formamidopyrimidine-DNA glycosylase